MPRCRGPEQPRSPRPAVPTSGARRACTAGPAVFVQEEITMTEATTNGSRPTVALVHGAFADSSGWNDVAAALLADGVRVRAISNPLRGLADEIGRAHV